ncbi:hypothetical protein GGX14DRAFT_555609 [Mycena pura]|uniref:CxC2-like cysteine cluster KDZ transposase-associated domain-containing protein n=1 Tax=Mycena pura TaxID=153505 RepID=A0AAD6UYK3_9AGAR|nr:hypothetical protein GGX14DRAFT_575998 [Mycena pura]KAJ7227026.1 hypothetical protein GGX14DRAFT_555609 [Mycena pura]
MFVRQGKRRREARPNHGTGATGPRATSQAVLATGQGTFTVHSQQHDGTTIHQKHYVHGVANTRPGANIASPAPPADPDATELPSLDQDACKEDTVEEQAIKRDRVQQMEQFKTHESIILQLLLQNHHDSNVETPCKCGSGELRLVRCLDCLQAPIVCRQCFLRGHRQTPTHWASVWNEKERFFEKTDISCVRSNSAIYLGHDGEFCPHALPRQDFTLVDTNGTHATVICFCGCDGALLPWQQLLRAEIFPATITSPQTGFTIRVLEQWREYRHQGHLSIWDFVHILQRLADAWTPSRVPNVSKYFDNISRYFQYLDTCLVRGQQHGVDDVLLGEDERAYPHRPPGYQGTVCAACPEPGVNMPLTNSVPYHLRHLFSENIMLDGNFKANLFEKRDNGTDEALTDGKMYFPPQRDFEVYAKSYVVTDADKEVPCKAHIGSIRNQGKFKYKNTVVSGVVASVCCHGLPAAFVDMLISEAFAIVAYAQTIHLRQKNSPPYPRAFQWLRVQSYDSYCSWVVNQLCRVKDLFPGEDWLCELIKKMEGQIPANHIGGHGEDCQTLWQPAYFGCRGHFHGEAVETVWPYLNALAPSLRQMNGGARHDNINFAMDAWNNRKLLRLADQLADERREALRVATANLTVYRQLSAAHPDEVKAWSRMSRKSEKRDGVIHSVYQHATKTAASINDVLESLKNSEATEGKTYDSKDRPATAEWVRWGLDIERLQLKTDMFLASHREHPLQDTWTTICDLRDKLNDELQSFRAYQSVLLPTVALSSLDVDKPEATILQLPSYLCSEDALFADAALIDQEVKLRCAQASSQILAAQDKTITLSIVKSTRGFDYRGQGGKTRAQRSQEYALMLRDLEITVYNEARNALISLKFMARDALSPFPPMTRADTVRKDTHAFRMRGDSRVVDSFGGWAGGSELDIMTMEDISGHATKTAGEVSDGDDEDVSPAQMGTQTRKRAGRGPTSPAKRRKLDTGNKKERKEGWIWKDDALSIPGEKNKNVAEYKRESECVQWFRAESEAFRWLEQYERKHAELWRVIRRFRRDARVWDRRAEQKAQCEGDHQGAVTYARMQAAKWRRLQRNAEDVFKSEARGAHKGWVQAGSFDDLVRRIDGSRDSLFQWMDDMGMERGYKHW